MDFNSDFKYDLRLGNESENDLAKTLSNSTVEVKHDKAFPYTGNLYIEYGSRGKPSGISTTHADYWAYKLGESWVLIPTDVLRSRLQEFKARCVEQDLPPSRTWKVRGGDSNTSLGMLLRITDVFPSR